MASRKGSPNKSTYEIQAIFTKCENEGKINWEKFLPSFSHLVYQRSLKRGGDKAAQIIVEYKFGKAPQPMSMTFPDGVKVIRDNR